MLELLSETLSITSDCTELVKGKFPVFYSMQMSSRNTATIIEKRERYRLSVYKLSLM